MSLVFFYKLIFLFYFNFNKYINNNTVSKKEHITNVKNTIKIS